MDIMQKEVLNESRRSSMNSPRPSSRGKEALKPSHTEVFPKESESPRL